MGKSEAEIPGAEAVIAAGALSVVTELGFKEVYHLSAGIIGWAEAEYPVTK